MIQSVRQAYTLAGKARTSRGFVSHNLRNIIRSISTSSVQYEKILISDPTDEICGKILRDAGHEVTECGNATTSVDELLKMIPEYDGLIVRSGTKVTAEVLQAANQLRIIGRAGTGVDNISIPEATRRGILVMNTPGGNTNSAAELTICHLMALARNIPQACASLKEGRWDRKLYTGQELTGKTIGVVGLGRIGRQVAQWATAMGMQVVGYDPILSEEAASKVGAKLVSLAELYTVSDYLTLHTPLTKETDNMLNDDAFAQCKKGVRLVNCARGGLIDEAALLRALESGIVAGAALDVYRAEPPPESSRALLNHPNVICTPHLGASTTEAQVNVARDIATQFVDALAKRKYIGVVNAPARLDLAARPDLQPYISLAERLGSLQAQFRRESGAMFRRIELTLRGTTVSNPAIAEVIKTAALKGLLSQIVSEGSVNMINTPMYAKELGIEVEVRTDSKSGHYANLLTLAVQTDDQTASSQHSVKPQKQRSMSATVFSPVESRLVQIDDFKVDIDPMGDMLFFRNRDQPGALHTVTSILGDAGVNIANFSLGRCNDGQALGVLTLDGPVSDSLLTEIGKSSQILQVWQASLPYEEQMRVVAGTRLHDSAAKRPSVRPSSPHFGSGPTKKRPGWNLNKLANAPLGRSHRSDVGKDRLKYSIDFTRELLNLPDGYRVGIVPGSDTGAFEMAMWSMLGARPVDIAHWESFGKGWRGDIKDQLRLPDVREFSAEYGSLPDMSELHGMERDVIFTWNGTTSGVRVKNGDFISTEREGLTFCDATSAVFCQDVEFNKCDVTTFSWQKALGGEGAHGMLILSPRAVERLETFTPNWPLPKIFRLTNKGKLQEGIFTGSTINTPSMLCVEDYIDALNWTENVGGVSALIKKANENLSVIETFVEENTWIKFLAHDPETRSNTSVCLTLDLEPAQVKQMVNLLAAEGVAYDIGAYRDAPAGLRIWCGATVEKSDLEALMPWLKWAYTVVQAQ